MPVLSAFAVVAVVAVVADVAVVAEVAVVADPADVANVAVAELPVQEPELPVTLIAQLPDAPEPAREGTSSAVCAAPAVLDPVPPLTTATVPVSLEAASDAMKDGSE